MLGISCPQCGKALKVREEQRGARVLCPACKKPLVIPAQKATPAAAGGWHFAQDNKKRGPISFAQLKSLVARGQLKANDLVLPENASKWVPVNSIPGLESSRSDAANRRAPRSRSSSRF